MTTQCNATRFTRWDGAILQIQCTRPIGHAGPHEKTPITDLLNDGSVAALQWGDAQVSEVEPTLPSFNQDGPTTATPDDHDTYTVTVEKTLCAHCDWPIERTFHLDGSTGQWEHLIFGHRACTRKV